MKENFIGDRIVVRFKATEIHSKFGQEFVFFSVYYIFLHALLTKITI